MSTGIMRVGGASLGKIPGLNQKGHAPENDEIREFVFPNAFFVIAITLKN